MQIRSATAADVETLVRFNAAMADETEDKALDQDVLRRGVTALLEDPLRGRYLLAEEDGATLGALAITLEWSDWRNGWFWWIQSVYVPPEARRRGVYRALYAKVLDEARAAGDVCGLRLYVERENAPAQETYASLGMSPAAYQMYEAIIDLGVGRT